MNFHEMTVTSSIQTYTCDMTLHRDKQIIVTVLHFYSTEWLTCETLKQIVQFNVQGKTNR